MRAFQAEHGLDVNGVWGRRTQQKFDQLQQQWAGQYDPEEIARLVMEGLNKLTGATVSASQAEAIPLSNGKGAGIVPLSGSRGAGQTVGAQTGAQLATLSTPTVTENRPAKGYTIPEGIDDVAAMQRMLGVGVDGVWGEETEYAYKKFILAGGKVPVSTEVVADELKELYQDVMASNLSPRQKTDALEMLAALQQYSTSEYVRKTLLGIQMVGGAEAFFRRPGGSSQDELVNGQKNLHAELKRQLEQKKGELEHFSVYERVFAPSPEYRALQEQKKDIENNIRAVEDRLNRFAYGWEKGISIPDWSEVDAWEQEQLAEAARMEVENKRAEASAEKQARDEAAAGVKDNLPVKSNIAVTKEQLELIEWKNLNDNVVAGLNYAIEALNLNTPEKVLYFLASIAHETGFGEKLTQKGSAWKYRGCGYLHITGEKRYKEFSEYMNDPDILRLGADYVAEKYPWESAIWYWGVHRKITPIIDDGGDFSKFTEYVKSFNEPVSTGRNRDYEKIKSTLFSDYDID